MPQAPPHAAALIGAAALVVGALLGLVAAFADAAEGPLGVALSLPGPWVAGAALVAALASRACGSTRRPIIKGSLCAAGFLIGGMVAYYAGKQALTGAIPGPLVALWLLLAAGAGLIGGAGVAWATPRPWGVTALAAGVTGWLLVEAAAVPSAPLAEAVVAVLIGTAVAINSPSRRLAPWLTGAVVGGAGALLVVSVLPAVLTRVL